ncbi:MAG: hypothetical protein EB015_17680, partial [Methylocystaceae bacterium]|nr:hypothetical protein [Methylocystaceae bacterium]
MSSQKTSPVVYDSLKDPRSYRRVEDHRFLTGQGLYVADITSTKPLYAAFLRSPHAHARILNIDTNKAKSIKGVYGVFTASDVVKNIHNPDGLGPLPTSIILGERSELYVPKRDVLCVDTVRFVGDLVAGSNDLLNLDRRILRSNGDTGLGYVGLVSRYERGWDVAGRR